ncbi:hypothetical protein ABZP36_018158 [Zizania latifolia]
MGNCTSFTLPKWRLSERHSNGMVSIDDYDTHEGIKTIQIQKTCEFTASSVLCVCIITWNMNGKMSVEDVTKLVSSNRKFDLLVVGLQEVPNAMLQKFCRMPWLRHTFCYARKPCSLFRCFFLEQRVQINSSES